ncbi:MAG: sigma 54-interacting transcriptional regulator [Acidobacteriota bacterium]
MTTDLARLLALSPGLAKALKGVQRAARVDAPVLLLGEAGSGRSTLARALHFAGDRALGPLVELDPGTVPVELFESDLFGYRSGAFTGAERDRLGKVARAEGGTLILDHLEALPLQVQPKLLRLLAERRYAPLGGAEVECDVRFVAIAGGDLRQRVEAGAFRGDLFFRLGVLAFEIPPLRQRRDEILQIADGVLADLAERLGRPKPRLASATADWMERHGWPGNLTELRAILERGLILSRHDPLEIPPPANLTSPVPRALVEVEREEILRALAYTRGRQGKAAELLGVSRKTLWEKRKRHGIP